ncbi:MAG: hypothetical protein KDL87_14425 [Verrucomicrobiae bacterium]|nr:hypothetical protein [Verrucomicrobiae bacterium]
MTLSTPIPLRLRLLVLTMTCVAHQAGAADPVISTFDTASGARGIHLRGGVTIRSISTRFHTSAPQPLRWERFTSMQSGLGDVGLYRGQTGILTYDDGFVGPDYGRTYGSGFPIVFDPSGDALNGIDSPSQIQATNRVALGINEPLYEVSFHSEGWAYASAFQGTGYETADIQTESGPYFELVVPLLELGRTQVNATLGYSWIDTHHGTGEHLVALQSVSETHSRYTYTYDYFGNATDPASTFPYDGTGRGGGGLIYDPAAFMVAIRDITGGLRPPRMSEANSVSSTRFFALSSADLDVTLHEIPLGVEWNGALGPVILGIKAGASLNVIENDLTHQLDWFQEGIRRPILSETDRSRGSSLRAGAFAGLHAILPLNRDGSVYLEAHGSYRWVDPVTAVAGSARVEIDASSWEGGVGMGIVFD